MVATPASYSYSYTFQANKPISWTKDMTDQSRATGQIARSETTLNAFFRYNATNPDEVPCLYLNFPIGHFLKTVLGNAANEASVLARCITVLPKLARGGTKLVLLKPRCPLLKVILTHFDNHERTSVQAKNQNFQNVVRSVRGAQQF